jgi:hypothetical protein
MGFRMPKFQNINQDLSLDSSLVSDHPSQTRSFRSSGFNRSRSASELLHAQKTKLPRLSTVCSGITRHLPDDIFGINPNQYLNPNIQMARANVFHDRLCLDDLYFEHLNLFRISDLEFGIFNKGFF